MVLFVQPVGNGAKMSKNVSAPSPFLPSATAGLRPELVTLLAATVCAWHPNIKCANATTSGLTAPRSLNLHGN